MQKETPSSMKAICKSAAHVYQTLYTAKTQQPDLGHVILMALMDDMIHIHKHSARIYGQDEFVRTCVKRHVSGDTTCSVHDTTSTLPFKTEMYSTKAVADSRFHIGWKGTRLEMAVLAACIGSIGSSCIMRRQISDVLEMKHLKRDLRAANACTTAHDVITRLNTLDEIPTNLCQVMPGMGHICEFLEVMSGDWERATPVCLPVAALVTMRRILCTRGSRGLMIILKNVAKRSSRKNGRNAMYSILTQVGVQSIMSAIFEGGCSDVEVAPLSMKSRKLSQPLNGGVSYIRPLTGGKFPLEHVIHGVGAAFTSISELMKSFAEIMNTSPRPDIMVWIPTSGSSTMLKTNKECRSKVFNSAIVSKHANVSFTVDSVKCSCGKWVLGTCRDCGTISPSTTCVARVICECGREKSAETAFGCRIRVRHSQWAAVWVKWSST